MEEKEKKKSYSWVLWLVGFVMVFNWIIGDDEPTKETTAKPAETVEAKKEEPKAVSLSFTDEDFVTKKNRTTITGKTDPGAIVTYEKGDGKPTKIEADSQGYFSFDVDTKKHGEHIVKVEAKKFNLENQSKTIIITREMSKKEKQQQLKKEAKSISYAKLKKNPDRYKGELVKFKGEIVQIMEDETTTQIRLAVTPTSYGWSINDLIFVEYEGITDFVEDDVVTIYGTIYGSFSYESQAGWEISLPGVLADIVE